jgi:hypothetical protein
MKYLSELNDLIERVFVCWKIQGLSISIGRYKGVLFKQYQEILNPKNEL